MNRGMLRRFAVVAVAVGLALSPGCSGAGGGGQCQYQSSSSSGGICRIDLTCGGVELAASCTDTDCACIVGGSTTEQRFVASGFCAQSTAEQSRLVETSCALPSDAGSGEDGGPWGTADAGGDGSAMVDAGPPARCDKSKSFGAPEEVPELMGFYFVSSVWLNATETEMIVTARPRFDDGGKLYRLRRASTAASFGPPELLPGVDLADRSEWSGALSADGLALFFDVARRVPHRATRSSPDATFSAGAPLAPDLSTTYASYVDVRPSARGVYLRYESYGSANLEFLPTGESYPTQVNLPESDYLTGYSLSADELTIYYSTTVHNTTSSSLRRATRATVGAEFSSATSFTLTPIATMSGGEVVSWVSQDECVLYGIINKIDQWGSYPHEVAIRASRPR